MGVIELFSSCCEHFARLLRYIGLLCVLVTSEISIAGPDDAYDPFQLSLGIAREHESNVFRIDEDEDVEDVVAPSASKSDDIDILSLGLLINAMYSQQQFKVDFALDKSRFSNNDTLDHNAGRAVIEWDWVANSKISGLFSIGEYRWLSTFIDTDFYDRDVLTLEIKKLEAELKLDSRNRIELGITDEEISHEADSEKEDNSETKTAQLSFVHESLAGNSIAVDYRYRDSEFPNEVIGVGNVTDAFNDETLRLRAIYRPSGKTHLRASIGKLSREYDASEINDFSDTVGELTFAWDIAEQWSVEISHFRDITAKRELGSDYYIETGERAKLTFSPLATLEAELSFERADHNYEVADDGIGTTPFRKDEQTNQALQISYHASRYLSFFLGQRYEKRKSNVGDEYKAEQYEAGISINL